jgi:uncharacterized protein (TIGR03000 family)
MFRTFVLALMTVLVVGETALARPWARVAGGRRSWNRVNDLGVDTGAFAGPYRGGQGRPYGNYYWPSYYGGYAYPVYGDAAPSYAPAPVYQQRSYYPPPQPATPAPATATIELYVPANAEVWFQGRKTNQTGTLRRFVTPPLNADAASSYELKVRWKDADGQVQEQTRDVTVQPGSQIVLNLQEAPRQ